MRKRLSLILFSMLLCFLLPESLFGQWSFDVPTVEILIKDHKSMKSSLFARATVEQANELLHDAAADASIKYKDINVQLDKYNKYFDVIDLIFNAGATALNIYSTYDDVSDKLIAMKKLNERFIERCVKRGNIYSSDSIVIKTYERMFKLVKLDAETAMSSLKDLVWYATGKAACKTSDLILILNRLNLCLDHIESTIDKCYITLWQYITVRTTYWKKSIYRAKTLKEICDEALLGWIERRNKAVKNGGKE